MPDVTIVIDDVSYTLTAEQYVLQVSNTVTMVLTFYFNGRINHTLKPKGNKCQFFMI